VPADLSIIGYDDIEAADYLDLTTIHQPLVETGSRAVQRLVRLIAGDTDEPLREVLDVHLVLRGTTAPSSA
jgi:LacI family transcriptional regulator